MANPIAATRDYLRQSMAELKKVSWPSKETTIRWSVLVVVASAALAGFFAALDFGFQTGVNALFANAPSAAAPAAPVIPDLEATTVESDVQPGVEVQSEPVPASPAPSGNGAISLPPIETPAN